MKTGILIVAGLLLTAVGLMAEPPLISNASIETRALGGTVDAAVAGWMESRGAAVWIGWEVPMTGGDQVLCCGQRAGRRWQTAVCELEGSRRQFIFSSGRAPTFLKSETLVVLLRADEGYLQELRAYSGSCELDAGGREVTWLEGADPQDSVEFLAGLIGSESMVRDEALMALALHATPKAPEKLATIASQNPDADVRGEALFWLAHTGSANASETILRALSEDSDADVRDQAVFALSLLPGDRGTELLLKIIQDRSRSSEVREHAFFWYVQTGDDRALDLISEILTN